MASSHHPGPRDRRHKLLKSHLCLGDYIGPSEERETPITFVQMKKATVALRQEMSRTRFEEAPMMNERATRLGLTVLLFMGLGACGGSQGQGTLGDDGDDGTTAETTSAVRA